MCDTVPMPEFTVFAGTPVSDSEVLALYESVGWTAYTRGSRHTRQRHPRLFLRGHGPD